MDRVIAAIVAVSFLCGMAADEAGAECRRVAMSCQSVCSNLQNDTVTDCTRRCRSIILCEAEPKQSARSRLPDDELPSGRLPGNRLPAGHLPDSFLN
ncbi:MAG: hypothetical protein AB7F74_15525 [Parvibaculaceae bacterium]